jgi:hypothetical protein
MKLVLILSTHGAEALRFATFARDLLMADGEESWTIATLGDDPAAAFAAASAGGAHSLLSLNPRRDLADQLEAVAAWVTSGAAELQSVVTVVDCAAAEAVPAVHAWYTAAIHFSDAVLLGNRATVAKKWIQQFVDGFRRDCFPCFFLHLKAGGRIEDALWLNYPQARRISQVFEPPLTPAADDPLAPRPEVDASFDWETDDDPAAIIDPILERYADGRRVKHLADIGPWVVDPATDC